MTRNRGKPILPRERPVLCGEANRHEWRARHERCVCGALLPYTIAVDGTLRKDHDRLSCFKRLQHPRGSEVVAVATLDRDRAEPVEHPHEQSGSPELRLRDKTQFPRDCRPEDDRVEHRLMIRGDDDRPGRGQAIGADHLDSINGPHQAAEVAANLFIGLSGGRDEILIFVHPRVDKSLHQATLLRRYT